MIIIKIILSLFIILAVIFLVTFILPRASDYYEKKDAKKALNSKNLAQRGFLLIIKIIIFQLSKALILFSFLLTILHSLLQY